LLAVSGGALWPSLPEVANVATNNGASKDPMQVCVVGVPQGNIPNLGPNIPDSEIDGNEFDNLYW
jgi:hypothetical protein